ncbi:hypothetical protein SSZBM1_195 [Synechococcus phage S-SZBM1]|uniref:Uncharacterized protein n=1 Tax=Synechococcus phage S-SZBM1 TaxID=2926475 RepID=A0AC61TSU7_9CAUD|nr:hypothetical protein PP650_gp081 [Synechococcus phage S-SZBM1]UNH61312.1 hypothetical protein SSZBM1_195 [Synechococcus phage S-SZBM1]
MADEVTLSVATNLSKATVVRVVNDTTATIVLTVDDAAVVAERGGADKYVALGIRDTSIAAGEVMYLEKDPLETIAGAGLKCTKVARQ